MYLSVALTVILLAITCGLSASHSSSYVQKQGLHNDRVLYTLLGRDADRWNGHGVANYIPLQYIDTYWTLATFVLGNGYWFIVNGTTLDHTFILPPGTDVAFSPTVYGIYDKGHYVFANATVITLCSTITDYLQYYGRGGPGANLVNITALSPYAFKVDAYRFISPTQFEIRVTNTTYTCDPSLDESALQPVAQGSVPELMSPMWYQAALIQRSTNMTLLQGVMWGLGPEYDAIQAFRFGNGSVWPTQGMRLLRGDYNLNCEEFVGYYGKIIFAAVDASHVPKMFTIGPNATLSLTKSYLYGMCAKAVELPGSFISFAKPGSNTSPTSNATVLPLASPLWPIELEAPAAGVMDHTTNANAPSPQLYVNGSTIFVSEQEASTLHYLTALQPHALASAGSSVWPALVSQGVARLAQMVVGTPAATTMWPLDGSASRDGGATKDFSQLGPGWRPPANLSADPIFAAYSVGPGVVRVTLSPTPNGGAMRDTTVGVMDSPPDDLTDMQDEPSWMPYNPATNTYPDIALFRQIAAATFCDTGAPLASSPSLFRPPLLTVGGLSPRMPASTRTALLTNSSYVAASAGEALAMATSWTQRNAYANMSTSYLPFVVLLFENSTIGINGTGLPLEVRGAMVVAGPVPPPPGLPRYGNLQLVPDFPKASARPTLDLANLVDAVHIEAGAATTLRANNGSRRSRRLRQHGNAPEGSDDVVSPPVMLLQRLRLINLSAQPRAPGQQPLALPLWAVDRPGRNSTTRSGTTAQLVLTSVTLRVPAAEFAALCATARLADALPVGQDLSTALHALRTSSQHATSFNKTNTTDWATTTAASLSPTASARDVLLAALFHQALDGVITLGSATITNLVEPTDISLGGNSSVNGTATGSGSSYGTRSSSSNGTTNAQLQMLHLDTYEGWGALGADITVVPDAPLASLELIQAANVSWLLEAASGNNAGPSSPLPQGFSSPPPLIDVDSDGGGRDTWRAVSATVGVAVAASVVGLAALVGAAWMIYRALRAPQPGNDIASQLASGQGHVKVFLGLGPHEDGVPLHEGRGAHDDETLGSAAGIISASGGSQSQHTESSAPSSHNRDPENELLSLIRLLKQRRDGDSKGATANEQGGEDLTKIADQLVLRQVLGRGAGGTVYRGSWKGLAVAVKAMIIPDDAPVASKEGEDDRPVRFTARQRAVTEAAVCCSLTHPNLVATYHYELSPVVATAPNIVVAQQQAGGSGKAQDWKLFLVQELCDSPLSSALTGGALHTSNGLPYLEAILSLLRDMASGMAYLHSRDIIHGDLKPENVMLCILDESQGPVDVAAKVTDFGLAVALNPSRTHISNCGHGTAFYIAPEVVIENRMTKAADVYSFGVMAWEMLINRPPYERDDCDGSIRACHYFWSTSPHSVPPQLHGFRDLCATCMDHNPRGRPSFQEVLKRLGELEAATL